MSCCERQSSDRWLLAGALLIVAVVLLYAAWSGAPPSSTRQEGQGTAPASDR